MDKILEKINQLSRLRSEIKNKYQELNALQTKIVDEIVESKKQKTFKSIEINETQQADLVWAFEKRIDYKRLLKDHPKIYKIGLKTTWSKTQALNAIESKTLLETILSDYTTIHKGYELKIKQKKRVKDNAE